MRVNTLSFCCLIQKSQLYNDIARGETTGIPRKIRISIHLRFLSAVDPNQPTTPHVDTTILIIITIIISIIDKITEYWFPLYSAGWHKNVH